ncbi:hypothetical protein TSOC_006705 [Tetrabaena socialis]|uniref:Uncharacterized protein n=1 Tax=Tetrabaena socialis TaxID=47790 RepID=A0A2J8A2Y9_9CHLO|nr:hypothetical protein TSOC_006705 [Tetrabaena socialis]|eukprot:PNH06880.1 hypothetical protein TSOC_006705 [Tetrabaena socialis]
MVVFKTTGGRAWNPPGGLRPLTPSQKRNRKKNVELTLKNMSVLKMAQAQQPALPVRLYKPLSFNRALWLKRKLEEARTSLGWGMDAASLQQQARAASPSLRGPGSLLPPAARAALAQEEQQQQQQR